MTDEQALAVVASAAHDTITTIAIRADEARTSKQWKEVANHLARAAANCFTTAALLEDNGR